MLRVEHLVLSSTVYGYGEKMMRWDETNLKDVGKTELGEMGWTGEEIYTKSIGDCDQNM